ncbi:NAD(P)/FAD-dependent oxidoreductase [Ktedonosporobacter rubrisoli]|uniref:NAD(P)/FAD-dependent oxidoreductase n=1 Tax=Ktedonosporobacter rubrisoli TaxID=2509675 RepID=A0A4P6JMI2_KTERU|nr:NAD(P)/FAD-dependent oxidoreductase [Ktedonosporobacter rubrisoli]QBD76232.1 NAD(P)/FAD-dependent oxidoreductase [Ktedonosporobacter rubrisoli]
MFDVIIVGGGVAGLSSALVLGRSRKRVLICDARAPRNAPSPGVHAFFSRDNIKPAELLQIGREQLRPYPSVEFRQAEVLAATRQEQHFVVTLADGTQEVARKLILATGVRDELPEIEGFAELWGTGVFHCPYCYGWEMRDKPLAIYGRGEQVLELVWLLHNWSNDLVLCSDGPVGLEEAELQKLQMYGIQVCEEPIARLEGKDGILERLVFSSGKVLPRSGLFLRSRIRQHSSLAAKLGCKFMTGSSKVESLIQVNENGWTGLPGLYAIGDAAQTIHWVSIAAAQGARAGIAISNELIAEALSQRL